MSTLLEISEEDALARGMELDEIQSIVSDLLPRCKRVVEELKDGEQKMCIQAFIMEAMRFELNHEIYVRQFQLFPEWVKENVVPVVLRWEEIAALRAVEAATSNFLGNPGQALILEATVTFWKRFENEWGERFLTLLKDEKGNVLKYWNNLNIIDPVLAQIQALELNPQILPENYGKRTAAKGDRVKFKATVKQHEIYKGVRGTTLQRARKVELIQAAPQA